MKGARSVMRGGTLCHPSSVAHRAPTVRMAASGRSGGEARPPQTTTSVRFEKTAGTTTTLPCRKLSLLGEQHDQSTKEGDTAAAAPQQKHHDDPGSTSTASLNTGPLVVPRRNDHADHVPPATPNRSSDHHVPPTTSHKNFSPGPPSTKTRQVPKSPRLLRLVMRSPKDPSLLWLTMKTMFFRSGLFGKSLPTDFVTTFPDGAVQALKCVHDVVQDDQRSAELRDLVGVQLMQEVVVFFTTTYS